MVNYTSASTLSVMGTTPDGMPLNETYTCPCTLVVHTPSEHTFNGTQLDVEVQKHFTLLANGTEGHAAISFFFDRELGGTENNTFIGEILELKPGQETMAPAMIGLQEFLTSVTEDDFYIDFYKGSETIPDCEEGSSWFIFQPI